MAAKPDIRTNKHDMDLDTIHGFVTNSYWAKGRTREAMQKAIDHSLNFGLFLHGKQVGYARVLTDHVAFAYLMDVFILPEHQGNGYSHQLLTYILNSGISVNRWMLATHNALPLYARYGFQPIEKPERLMEKLNP